MHGVARRVPTLPAFAPVMRAAISQLVGQIRSRDVVVEPGCAIGPRIRNLGQHAEQGAGDSDRLRVAQRSARTALILNLGGALRTERQVMRGAQVRIHPQFTVDKCGDGLGGQVLRGAELAWRAHGRVALGGKLRGQPGERSAEHLSPIGHHLLLSTFTQAYTALL
ncbi:hypothetical protein I553_9503 [Mycobacterium xenopi 4042]|uniref:Uncharacterized protein n=1 Tax=Mycobacterium xenopi 4042 TaxID=1299334 RepID=X8DXI7_MYCXE|nr:hypothetical protein I553_9503 [Mycobacterium xenopi 4042]